MAHHGVRMLDDTQFNACLFLPLLHFGISHHIQTLHESNCKSVVNFSRFPFQRYINGKSYLVLEVPNACFLKSVVIFLGLEEVVFSKTQYFWDWRKYIFGTGGSSILHLLGFL